MRIFFIINPRSGPSGARSNLLPAIEDSAKIAQEAVVCLTEEQGHATDLARDAVARGFTRVVAVGGDGTINEVASALIHTPVELGIIPRGSGNGLARHLAIPLRFTEALQVALNSDCVRPIDAGTVNGSPFFNAMGMGLDAEISYYFSHSKRRGLPVYLWTGLTRFLAAKPANYTVAANGKGHELNALMLTIANSDQYGNGAVIAPGAQVDDGALDLIGVRKVNVVGACLLGLRLFKGSFDTSSAVTRVRASQFEIKREQPALVHLGGEARMEEANLSVKVLPKSLRVVVAAKAGA